MILYVNDNVGIIFLRTVSGGPIISYIFGTILGATLVSSRVVGFGPISITINTYTTVSASAILKGLISGLINTWTTITASGILRGVLSGIISTWSTVTARMTALARMFVSIFTQTYVRAFVNLPIVVTEVIKKISAITSIFKRNSKIDGD